MFWILGGILSLFIILLSIVLPDIGMCYVEGMSYPLTLNTDYAP